jgi:hypothetical protein
MALVTQAIIDAALATLFEDVLADQINRAVVLGQVLEVKQGNAKDISWIAKTGTEVPTTAVIADGADVTTFNNDTKQPASLDYGTYHDAFSLTGRAMAAARAAKNPAQLAALFEDELGDSIERLAVAIAVDIYTGDGSTDTIHGMHDSTVPAIGDTGVYAGIDRSSVAQWQGQVVDALTAGLSFGLIRQLGREIYDACGYRPDLYVTDPVQHDKLGDLYQTERRYVDQVRTAQGVITLDGGYHVLEFDGVSVLEDKRHPAQTFTGLNTMYTKLWQLPDAPDVVNKAMGTVQLGGTGEQQKGEGKMGFRARIQPLATTGDAFKFALYVYPQLQVKRPNSCGYLENLAA